MPLPSLSPFDRSKPGFWLSSLAHGLVLAAGIVTYSASKLPEAEEGIPVEMVTDSELNQITRGEVTAAKVQPDAKPRAERQAEARVERDPGEARRDVPAPPTRPADVKLAEAEAEAAKAEPVKPEPAKPEPAPMPPARPDRTAEAAKAEAASAEAARAEAARAEAAAERAELKRRKLADAKAEAEAQAKAQEKAQADAQAKAQEKAEAEAKAKAEAEKRRRLAEAKAKIAARKAEEEAKARRQAELAEKFSPGDISRILASKEPAQSTGATARETQKTASLGTAAGNAQRLSPSMRGQIAGIIREQLIRCWQPPMAVQTAPKAPTAQVRLGLKEDGSLSTEPVLMNSSNDPLFRPVADSALRATRRCAPLRIPANFAPYYQDWKDLVVDFDPREMG